LSAGYTELRVHIWPTAGSSDTSRGAAEANAPNRQVFLRSSWDLPGRFGVDGWFRYIAAIENQDVPGYAELNARLAWQPTASLDVALVGQNLLHDRHAEFGAPSARREIERGVYGVVEWRF
jgi:iron complex outermembrane receptor protein